MEDRKPFIDGYKIYKPQTAMSFKLLDPKLKQDSNSLEPGGYMIQMANVLTDATRKYDWKNAVNFFISASEAMKFAKMLERANPEEKIYHDPDKGREGEGSRAKILSVGTFESKKYIQIYLPKNKDSFKIFIDEAETDTLVSLIRGTLPKVFGW